MSAASGAKRLLDIEDVVAWACAELGKRRGDTPYNYVRHDASLVGRWTHPPGFPTVSPMFAGVAGGGSASAAGSSWERAPRAPRAAGPPDEDAITIEEAADRLAAEVAGSAAPETLALDIGLPVDVEGAFRAALANVENIVMTHGLLGKRPAFGREAPAPMPALAPNGKPQVLAPTIRLEKTVGGEELRYAVDAPTQALRSGVYASGAFCPLEYDPDPQFLVNERAEYAAWRAGLEALAGMLAGRLARIAALPPSAPAAPWLGERDAGKPADLFGASAERLYSRMELLSMAARQGERRPVKQRREDMWRPARPARAIKGTGG